MYKGPKLRKDYKLHIYSKFVSYVQCLNYQQVIITHTCTSKVSVSTSCSKCKTSFASSVLATRSWRSCTLMSYTSCPYKDMHCMFSLYCCQEVIYTCVGRTFLFEVTHVERNKESERPTRYINKGKKVLLLPVSNT